MHNYDNASQSVICISAGWLGPDQPSWKVDSIPLQIIGWRPVFKITKQNWFKIQGVTKLLDVLYKYHCLLRHKISKKNQIGLIQCASQSFRTHFLVYKISESKILLFRQCNKMEVWVMWNAIKENCLPHSKNSFNWVVSKLQEFPTHFQMQVLEHPFLHS